MIRLRVTDLDAWVGYVEPERDEFEVSTEQFLAHMRRQAPETEAMRIGRAFHRLLERAQPGDEIDTDCTGVAVDGFRFFCGPDLVLEVPQIREQATELVYSTPSGLVLLRGQVDGREGLEVTDYKLTLGTFDAERYADSLQWRAYLDMTGAKRFRYVVFGAKAQGPNVWLHEVHELAFWSYPDMHGDVRGRVGELAAFVSTHLPEMDQAPASGARR